MSAARSIPWNTTRIPAWLRSRIVPVGVPNSKMTRTADPPWHEMVWTWRRAGPGVATSTTVIFSVPSQIPRGNGWSTSTTRGGLLQSGRWGSAATSHVFFTASNPSVNSSTPSSRMPGADAACIDTTRMPGFTKSKMQLAMSRR